MIRSIVQNYRLNKWTAENNYPLFLISDIVENIDIKKVFTQPYFFHSYYYLV